MDNVELLADALVTGMSAGISGTMSTGMQDAYRALCNAVRRALPHRASGTDVLASLEVGMADPEAVRRELVVLLTPSGIGGDAQAVAAARQLLALVGQSGTRNYTIDLRGARGVQTGDGNSMTININ